MTGHIPRNTWQRRGTAIAVLLFVTLCALPSCVAAVIG